MPAPEFDPSKPFEADSGPQFDPSKPFEHDGAVTPPQVGGGETLANRYINAIPGASFLTNAIGALTGEFAPRDSSVKFTPKALAEMRALGLAPVEAKPRGFGDLVDQYREVRDERRLRDLLGAEQNPWAARAGTGLGIAGSLSLPLPAVGRLGKGLFAGRYLPGILTGGAYGAEMGLEHGSADLTRGEFGQAAKETGLGAVIGSVLGGGVSGLVHGASALAPKLMPILEQLGISQGRRVLTNGADTLSKNLPISEDAVRAANEVGAFGAFGTNARALSKLNAATETAGDNYATIVANLQAKGVPGPNARQLAADLVTKGQEVFANTADRDLQSVYSSKAQDILDAANANEDLALTQAENIKRALQKKAKYGKFEETPLNEERRTVASMMRQAVEDRIASEAAGRPELEELASQFVPAKQTLGDLLEAEAAATRGASRGAQRGHFGLKETIHAGAAVASGHPYLAPMVGIGSGLLRNRGASTVASSAFRLADLLRGAQAANVSPAVRNLSLLLSDYLRPAPVPAFASSDERFPAFAVGGSP